MVIFRLTRKRAIVISAVSLIGISAFAVGLISRLHLKSDYSDEIREHRLLQTGDAPPAVRAQVLTSLRAFQAGYVKRDPASLDAFINELFPKDGQILIMGTEGGGAEWARGYPAVSDFIRTDWREWGDFRFNVDDSIIWSSGDVAWVASIGSVHFRGLDRPLRLTAILTRDGERWRFRQLHFQWDENGPGADDVLRPSTYFRFLRSAIRHIAHN
jgi:SnoaL-like domain